MDAMEADQCDQRAELEASLVRRFGDMWRKGLLSNEEVRTFCRAIGLDFNLIVQGGNHGME